MPTNRHDAKTPSRCACRIEHGGALLLCLGAIAAFGPSARAQTAQSTDEVLNRNADWIGDESVYMIAIEALVVEVNEKKTRDLGIKYGFASTEVEKIIQGADFVFGPKFSPVGVPTLNADPDTGRTSVGFTPRLPGLGVNLAGMDISGGVLSARIRSLLNIGEAKITARPIVLAVNGKNAVINVGNEIPYQDIVIEDEKEMIRPAWERVGVEIDITPTILDLGAGTIDLMIHKLDVSSLSTFFTTRNVERPVFNKSTTSSMKITVKAGETNLVASLKAHKQDTYRSGIPILMHIPIMGAFFSSRQEQETGVDILFFITTYIVPPGQNVLLPFDFRHGVNLIDHGVNLAN